MATAHPEAGVLEAVLPEQVFDWSQPGELSASKGRLVMVAQGVAVEFKSAEDAAGGKLAIAAQPPSLTVDARGCSRYVRIRFELDRLAGFLQALEAGTASVDLRVPLRPLDFDAAQLEWIALLSVGASGERVLWKRLVGGARIAAPQVVKGAASCSWSELDGATGLELAIQLAPGSPPLRLERLTVTVNAASTLGGRLQLTPEVLQGWVPPGSERDAALRLWTAAGAAADLGGAMSPPLDDGRFSVPRPRIENALREAGAVRGTHSVELWVGEVLAAKARIPVEPPRLAPAPPKPPPGRFDKLSAEALADRVKRVADADEIQAGVSELYTRREPELLWRLHAEVVASADASPVLKAYATYLYSRSMLDMNAAETAYRTLHTLLADPSLCRALLAPDRVRVRKLLARACLRSGRADESAELLHALVADHPTDWESYFQLGVLQGSAEPDRRRFHHAAAEALTERMPTAAVSYIAESWLAEGRPDEAIARVVRELRRAPDEAELHLNLCNIHQRMGAHREWARGLEAYFGHYGLSAPPFALNTTPLFRTAMPTATPTAPRDGPLVTVVMTAFNAEATLEAAARSVLAQSHANLRLIIVDDVSTDRSRQIIEALKQTDDRVASLYNEANVGTYCAKNRALQSFPSDIYAFHDSDDWMHPERLSEHVKAMTSRPDLAFCTSMWIRMEETGRAVIRRSGGFLHENPASAFFRAELLDSVGYFDSVRTGADSEFAWRVRRRFGAKATLDIRKPLAVGLHHGASLTQSGAAAFDDHRYSPVRLNYWESWIRWHHRAVVSSSLEQLRVPFPLAERPFDAPPEILPSRLAA